MAGKAKKDVTPGVVETGKEIRRTNQTYINIKALGNCDEKGKSVLSVGYGRWTAPPDRGLGLAISLIQELGLMVTYSSSEAAENDLQKLKDYVNGLFFKGKNPKEEVTKAEKGPERPRGKPAKKAQRKRPMKPSKAPVKKKTI